MCQLKVADSSCDNLYDCCTRQGNNGAVYFMRLDVDCMIAVN